MPSFEEALASNPKYLNTEEKFEDRTERPLTRRETRLAVERLRYRMCRNHGRQDRNKK